MYIENQQLKNHISVWLAFIFVILTIMIVVGGLTRLTDSGLSITEWELFSGILPPLNNSDWIIYVKEHPFQNPTFGRNLRFYKDINNLGYDDYNFGIGGPVLGIPRLTFWVSGQYTTDKNFSVYEFDNKIYEEATTYRRKFLIDELQKVIDKTQSGNMYQDFNQEKK